jgi:hypothetical protein
MNGCERSQNRWSDDENTNINLEWFRRLHDKWFKLASNRTMSLLWLPTFMGIAERDGTAVFAGSQSEMICRVESVSKYR